MTETTQQEHVRGALGGIVIALAVVIAIFAFFALARAETIPGTPSANVLGATPVHNGAASVIGTSTNTTPNTMGSTSADTSAPMSTGASTTGSMESTTATGSAGTSAEASTTGMSAGGSEAGTPPTPAIAPLLRAEPPAAPAPMVVMIDREGGALVRGVVETVGTDTLTLATWGGTWTITTATDTSMASGGLGSLHVGDFVGVAGVVSGKSAMNINASVVRDWTMASSSHL